MTSSFWRWLWFWICVPAFWLCQDDGYWIIKTSRDSSRGYKRFSDFRKAMIGE
jgi:hypothetical protein